jgi:hypothetical protein
MLQMFHLDVLKVDLVLQSLSAYSYWCAVVVHVQMPPRHTSAGSAGGAGHGFAVRA